MSTFPPTTIALIASAILPGVPVTARELELSLPFHYCRGTVRGVLAHLAKEGRLCFEEVQRGQCLQKVYRVVS
jgi:hypothetical protein